MSSLLLSLFSIGAVSATLAPATSCNPLSATRGAIQFAPQACASNAQESFGVVCDESSGTLAFRDCATRPLATVDGACLASVAPLNGRTVRVAVSDAPTPGEAIATAALRIVLREKFGFAVELRPQSSATTTREQLQNGQIDMVAAAWRALDELINEMTAGASINLAGSSYLETDGWFVARPVALRYNVTDLRSLRVGGGERARALFEGGLLHSADAALRETDERMIAAIGLGSGFAVANVSSGADESIERLLVDSFVAAPPASLPAPMEAAGVPALSAYSAPAPSVAGATPAPKLVRFVEPHWLHAGLPLLRFADLPKPEGNQTGFGSTPKYKLLRAAIEQEQPNAFTALRAFAFSAEQMSFALNLAKWIDASPSSPSWKFDAAACATMRLNNDKLLNEWFPSSATTTNAPATGTAPVTTGTAPVTTTNAPATNGPATTTLSPTDVVPVSPNSVAITTLINDDNGNSGRKLATASVASILFAFMNTQF